MRREADLVDRPAEAARVVLRVRGAKLERAHLELQGRIAKRGEFAVGDEPDGLTFLEAPAHGRDDACRPLRGERSVVPERNEDGLPQLVAGLRVRARVGN